MKVLIVEDEPVVAHAIARLARGAGEAHLAPSVAAADYLLAERHDWGAFIVDVGLPDGSGMELLVRARKAYPVTPALVLTGFVDPQIMHAAFELRARYIAKSFFDPKRVVRFLREASASNLLGADPMDSWAHAWEARYKLSPSETDVLFKFADGASREEIAELRESSPWMVKALEKRLCQKTGDVSMRDAVTRFLREVARGGREGDRH
jgi:DNA-binding NarL/FixJ family response regulator